MPPIVIHINSLAEFELEAPPPATIRLNLTERQSSRKYTGNIHVPLLNVHLDLQAVNDQQQIVWLHGHWELEQQPGGGFWGAAAASIYEQLPDAKRMIGDYLAGKGYEVRGGQFGVPDNIKPIRGVFECLDWTKNGDGSFHLKETTL